jgi:molybdenum cofactor guanylyltransferase
MERELMEDQATGIIMAGGKSTRMGKNKALLKIGGQTVIERIANELRKAVSELLIVTNTPEDYQFLGLPMIEDQWKGMGPLAGIHAGLEASKTEKNLVVACDMPFVSSEIGGYLLRFLDHYQGAVPRISGQLHPLFAAYRKDALSEISKALEKQELKIRLFFDRIQLKYVTEEDLKKLGLPLENHFFNMNDLKEFSLAVKMASLNQHD